MTTYIEKICGWLLVSVGLALIVYSVGTSYGYFIGKGEFPALVEAPVTQSSDEPANDYRNIDLSDPQQLQQMMQFQVQDSVDKAIGSMISGDSFAKTINAALWSLFATFLVYTGAKVAEIGTKLLAVKTQIN